MKVSARKLTALGYPVPPKELHLADETQFRSLVYWLEDQKICHLKIEDRSAIKDPKSVQWNSAFRKYLTELKCPFNVSDGDCSIDEILDWLLALAISLEYADNVERYKTEDDVPDTSREGQQPRSAVTSDNPLDKLDFECDDFKRGVEKLAKLLNVAQHPDHLITLQAVCSVIQNRLSLDAIEQANKTASNGETKCPDKEGLKRQRLGDLVSGLNPSEDPILQDAVKGLRLLHVQELRHLQTLINQTIVAVQKVTADPRTDERLGKIGGFN